jgi:Skp family chaperone for outer membrane proteins
VLPRATDNKGKSYGRVFSFGQEDAKTQAQSAPSATSRSENTVTPMAKTQPQSTKSAPRAPAMPPQSANRSETTYSYEHQTMSKKVFEALSDDTDPSKALADIRRLLVGPAAQLHEARMEEVISILEESDRTHNSSIANLELRCNELAAMCERLLSANEEAHGKIQSNADYFNSEIQKANKAQQDKLSELFIMFDNKLQKMSAEMHQLVDTLAAKTSSDYQALANDVVGRVQQLASSTAANHDKLVTHFENRLNQAEAVAEQDKRKQLDSFAEGFADLADRLLSLRKGQG